MPTRRPARPWRRVGERLRWSAVRGWRRVAPHWPLLLLAPVAALAVWGPLAAWPAAPAWVPLAPRPLLPWLAAAAAAAAAAAVGLAARRAAPETRAAADAGLLVLAATGAHLAGALLVDAPLAWAPLAGIVLVVAAARFRPWWAPFAALGGVAALELGRAALIRPGWAPVLPPPGGAPAREELGVALGALAALAAVAAALARRARRERLGLEREVAAHRRLRDEAQDYGALAEHRRSPSAEHLAPEQREARALSVVVERDRLLDRLLELARLAVGARGLFLMLLDDDGELLRLCRCAAAPDAPPVDPGAAARLGEGVVGHAARSRRAAQFGQLDPAAAGVRLWADASAPVSLLVVPVSEDGVFRGVMAADSAAAGAFGAGHEELLASLAAEVGEQLAASRAELLRERRGVRLEALGVIVRELSSTLVQQEMFEKMLDLLGTVVPYDRGAYFSADPEARRLRLRAERGFGVKPGREVTLPFGRGPAGTIAQRGEHVLFTNLRARSRGVEIVPRAGGQERIASLVGVPLVHRRRLVGVCVLASERPGSFAADHLDILELVAAEAAVLIANAGLHETIERLAVTDGLTGLYNHRHFQEQLGKDLVRAGRTGDAVSLVLLDIDHFKRINDTHGHPFGDEVLRTLARTLGKLARRTDVVARYGGEEFALLLYGTDRRGCRRTAERVLRAVREIRVPRAGGEDFSFTASLGTASWPADGATREELVRAADRALYGAKHGGRDRAVAHEELGRLL